MNDPLALVDVERRLGLFALAIAGRAYHIRADSDFKSAVIGHRPGLPLSDGETLYLPETVERFDVYTHNLGAYRLMALHQLCFAEFGTLTLDIDEAQRRVPALNHAADPEPAPRESDLALLFRRFPWPALARALFTVFEGARVDTRMLSAYPGIRRDYDRCCLFERGTRSLPPACTSAPEFVEALIGWTLGYDTHQLDTCDSTGSLRAMIGIAALVTRAGADVYDTVTAMTDVYAVLESLGVADPPVVVLDGDIETATEAAGWPAPVSFHGEAPADWQQREARLERWEDELATMDRGATAEMEHAEAMSGRGGGEVRPAHLRNDGTRDTLARRIDMERSAIRHALARDDRPSGASFLYDEWDLYSRRYLRGWCRLYESRIEADDDSDVAALLERVAPHREAVQRRFSQIKPHAYRPIRRVTDGDELDLEELLDYYVETSRGNGHEDRVYRRKDRVVRDVAAAFLLDLSASTDDPVEKPAPPPIAEVDLRHVNLRDPFDDDDYLKSRTEDPGPPPRRIIDVLRESLLLMASALEHYRDHWGLYAFSGYGRDNVEYYVVKEFSERFGYSTLEALAALRPRRSTRMGPAIRHSAWKLKRTASPLKVLIMVSDGFPQDCDYGPDRADHEYGVQDTAKALEEAHLAGIETFCVTVDRSGHDYLKRMCQQDRYLVIDELEALPTELAKVYQKLTGARRRGT